MWYRWHYDDLWVWNAEWNTFLDQSFGCNCIIIDLTARENLSIGFQKPLFNQENRRRFSYTFFLVWCSLDPPCPRLITFPSVLAFVIAEWSNHDRIIKLKNWWNIGTDCVIHSDCLVEATRTYSDKVTDLVPKRINETRRSFIRLLCGLDDRFWHLSDSRNWERGDSSTPKCPVRLILINAVGILLSRSVNFR